MIPEKYSTNLFPVNSAYRTLCRKGFSSISGVLFKMREQKAKFAFKNLLALRKSGKKRVIPQATLTILDMTKALKSE
jgi:hypothetical protein